MTKRHTTPTPAQLANRTYRKVLSLESEQRSAYRMLMERMETIRASLVTLTDHCARLLREKETLVRMLEKNGIVWAHVPREVGPPGITGKVGPGPCPAGPAAPVFETIRQQVEHHPTSFWAQYECNCIWKRPQRWPDTCPLHLSKVKAWAAS